MDTTFTALASVARPFLQDFISEQPPTYDTAVAEFPKQRPFLRNSAAFFRELRPGVAALPAAAPPLADAFEIGTRVLPEDPGAEPPAHQPVPRGRQAARRPAGPARPRAPAADRPPRSSRRTAFVAPVQATCNYATLFLRNAASLLSEGDANGTYQRFSIIAATVGAQQRGQPVQRPRERPRRAPTTCTATRYPNTASPGQTKECEAGNERYVAGQECIGNAPGNQRRRHRRPEGHQRPEREGGG